MNDSNITIEGLSKAQVKMLDIMWSIDSYNDYIDFKSGLSEDALAMVDLLESMLFLADLDIIEDVTQAKQVLAKFAL